MDNYPTRAGELGITMIGHGSLMIDWQDKVIQVDPYSEAGNYAELPQADMILLTHDHYDHYDPKAFNETRKADTVLIGTVPEGQEVSRSIRLKNGEETEWEGIDIKAVPAYNILHGMEPGVVFHPKGYGNGYVLDAAGLRVYIAGDTEPIPEMKELGPVDIAFLPCDLPYTMTEEMLIEAAKTIRPKVLYPYHYNEIDKAKIERALPGIEVKWG